MKPADLKFRLVLQRLRDAEDDEDFSEGQKVWQPVRVLRAKVTARSGNEIFNQSQMQSIQSYDIETWYFEDISPADRLVDSRTGEIYQIDTVPNRPTGKTMIIKAREWQLQQS